MRIRAILFDLHETLTKFEEHPKDIFRRVSDECGIKISQFTESERDEAFLVADEWFKSFQIESNVGPLYGSQPQHWIEWNRIMFEELGLADIDETTLMRIERNFKDELLALEGFTDAAIKTVKLLHERGYPMGIVTRRYDNPNFLVSKFKLNKYFSTIHWSGIHGYEKPSPFSLLQAAEEISVNPKLCAYVGNDLTVDVAAAQRAQMLPVLLKWAKPEEASLAPEGVIIRTSPLELLDMFHSPDILLDIS